MVRRKILLIRPGAMGDVCLAMPLVRALVACHEVHWLIRRHYAPLVQRFPEVCAHLIPSDLDASILPLLRQHRFDAVVDLSHWPEVSRLVQQLQEIPIRAITFDPDQDARLGVNPAGMDLYAPYNHRIPVNQGIHQVARWQTLIQVVLDSGRAGVGPLRFHKQRPSRTSVRVFVHPHAGKSSKLWPIPNYVKVLTELSHRYRLECWINSGNRPEWLRTLSLWARLRWHGVRAHILPRDRSYRRLVDTLSTMDLAFGSDSGPMHLAALVGTPTVVLFGPYPASEFRPLWQSQAVSPAIPGAPAATIPVAEVKDTLNETLATLGVTHVA